MSQRYPESQTELEDDPHALLFGPDAYDDLEYDDAAWPEGDRGSAAGVGQPAQTRSERRHALAKANRESRRRTHGGIWVGIALVIVAAVVVSMWLIVPKVWALFHAADYSGSGTGHVAVTIDEGETTSDIGDTLLKAQVVKSQKAFVDAASNSSAAQTIQPGTYNLRRHMSAKSALALLLSPSSRSASGDLLVTEGATQFDVQASLAKILGANKLPAIRKALANPQQLGLPLGYAPQSGKLTSAEGFLFPATYPVDPHATPVAALQRMTGRFVQNDRATGFAQSARKVGLTPYQALIIASIAQAEARYPQDMSKVARVILNRIKAHRPLQIDATSAYGAKAKGLDPTKIIYATIDSPYNTYTHSGLPPTPISNPGAEALNAAVHPSVGNWLYYVNGDAAGHLFFTANQNKFDAAANKCHAHNWGCG